MYCIDDNYDEEGNMDVASLVMFEIIRNSHHSDTEICNSA